MSDAVEEGAALCLGQQLDFLHKELERLQVCIMYIVGTYNVHTVMAPVHRDIYNISSASIYIKSA